MTANNRHEAETARVRLARIDVEEGLNPRQRTDEQADTALAESVRAHGLLQPLVVTAGADGRYTLIAGHRRHRAARAAGLAEVAVLVRDRSENALELAVVENLQRSDLDPVSEARGFERLMRSEKLNQTGLAKRLSIPRKRVSERLRLLRLPEPVQERFAAGELRGTCAAVLERIAKVSPEVASACAEAAAGDNATADLLSARPGAVVAGVANDPDGPALVALGGYGGQLLEELALPAEGVEDIHQRYTALATDGRGPVRVALGDEDADAARAYGCLLEFAQDRYWTQQFVCDPAFIADRVRLALDRIEARRREQDAEALRQHAPHAPARADGEAPGAIDMQEARRQEREHEQDERSAARGANLDLGRALMEAFEAPKLSADLAHLVSALVLGRDTAALAARGLRYVREDWQTLEVRELKSGGQRRKVSYLEPHAAGARMVEWFEQAKSAEQMLGRVIQALAAAHLADEACVAQSKRSHYALSGSYGGGLNACVPELVERLAKAHLPKRLAEQQRERERLSRRPHVEARGQEPRIAAGGALAPAASPPERTGGPMAIIDDVLARGEARPVRRIDWARMNAIHPKQQAALTRAVKTKDPEKVAAVCKNAIEAWNECGPGPMTGRAGSERWTTRCPSTARSHSRTCDHPTKMSDMRRE